MSGDILGQQSFVVLLNVAEARAEREIVRKALQFAELFQIKDPAVADSFRDELGECRVGFEKPAAEA